MLAAPVALQRPVVVMGGWRAPPPPVRLLSSRVARLTSGNAGDFLCVTHALAGDVDSAAARAAERIGGWLAHRSAPRSVDIIAISMGGLVARLLATGSVWADPADRIEVRRLFTLSTPHRGASLARWIRPDRAAAAMRAGSELYRRLDAALEDPATRPGEMYCYAQRLDWWVGTWNTAPRGHVLRCVHARGPISAGFSHFTVHMHPGLVIELARRLRGEPGLAGAGSGSA